MGYQCTIVGKEDFLEEALQALYFGSEEGAVQTIANVDTFLQVTDSVGQHASEEDIEEERCYNTALLHPVADCEGFRHIPAQSCHRGRT